MASTGSAVAERILGSWGTSVGQFVKVMPLDYKRVLAVLQQAETEGLAEEAALQRVMEASHG